MAMISAATAPKLKRNIKTRVLCAARTNAVIKGRHAGEGRSTTNALRKTESSVKRRTTYASELRANVSPLRVNALGNAVSVIHAVNVTERCAGATCVPTARTSIVAHASSAASETSETLSPTLVTASYIAMWYSLNIAFNLTNKTIFGFFPFPWTVSTVHVVVGSIYCGITYLLGLKKVRAQTRHVCVYICLVDV